MNGYLPPMWALWLNDPSGKYGPHKAFFEHGESAEAAYASAIARYTVAGVTVDEMREPCLAAPRSVPPTDFARLARDAGIRERPDHDFDVATGRPLGREPGDEV